MRALRERTCRARWLACIWATLVCSMAAAEPSGYPGTASTLALPPSLQVSNSADRATGISPNLAQPAAVQPVGTAGRSDSSAEVPGILQPQFLITDQAGPASTPSGLSVTDRQTNQNSQTKHSDSANDRYGQADDQSSWSQLWRQTTGNTQAKAKAFGSGTTTSQNTRSSQSVWNDLVLPPKRQTSAAPPKQTQSPDSYNPLASQLGFSDHAAFSSETDSDFSAAPSVSASDSRMAKSQPTINAANLPANATTTTAGFAGLWNQISGGGNAASANDTNDAGGIKQTAVWTAESKSQTEPEAAPPTAGFWSSLSRPLTAQTNEAPVRRPTVDQTADTAADSAQPPSLLMPFYHTNTVPQANRGATQIARARALNHGQDLANTVRASKLLQQLASTTDEDLRSQPGAIADAPLRTTHEAWDGGWTLRVPTELNPFNLPTSVPEPPVGLGSQAMTVAYLQDASPTPAEAIPEPEKINLPDSENSASGDQPEKPETSLKANNNDEGGENGDGKKKDKLATADKLGKKPEDRSLEFLRAETVLLKPGRYQFDIGFQYTIQERNFPILLTTGAASPSVASIPGTNRGSVSVVQLPGALPGAYGGNVNAEQAGTPGTVKTSVATVGSSIVGVDEAHFKSRELEVPMQLRYGLFDKVQVFVGAPVGWSNTEADLNHLDEFRNDGGLGDIYWGTTIQFAAAEADCPYVIGTFVATAPSGGDPFTSAVGISPSGPSLGNGFWRLAGNLLFIQPLDPVTFFYGAGIRGSFEHDYVGVTLEPGLEYNYTFGLGFAINEKVTLSTQLFGEYQSRLQVNGRGIEGTSQEPISLQFAATIARPCERYVEPFIQFGLTEDAAAANIGITWTY
jgi:hypothetical protein